jgi:2-polyprenyl-3-methyl-5-hydroxy-6-metoxy-1,4-benzoquinol methylase
VREAVLEPLMRGMRLRRVMPAIQRHAGCRLLDIGCGWEARLLREVESHLGQGVGIDFKAPDVQTGKITTLRASLDDTLPFDSGAFDMVTMLAVLEHLARPEDILREIGRVLVPGGKLVLTVPSKAAKPVLEFLAFRLGVVSRAEIEDHKAYYDRQSLHEILTGTGFEVVEHRYFQLGMNNYCLARPVS